MKIFKYEYCGPEWKMHEIRFQKINLIVGDSGTGKTRLLNTIFNLGSFVAQRKLGSGGGWNLSLGIDEDKYLWKVNTIKKGNEVIVENEELFQNEKPIIERGKDKFLFKGKPLPKLPRNEMSLSILREDEAIKPLYDGFSRVLRRSFFRDALAQNSGIFAVNRQLLEKLGGESDLYELYKANLPLNPKLYVLSSYFPAIYNKIIDYYREIFEFITEVQIRDSSDFDLLNVPGRAPVFCIKEGNIDEWLRLDQLSSGMQKVLLILTDLFSLPGGGIYLVDEYENSLGIGAIDFLPDLLFGEDFDVQIIITSHHPYIINNIPVENWFVAHRKGRDVQFAYGEKLVARYNISSQGKYIQLLNDPFYSEGIE